MTPVSLFGSKSVTQRALVCAALAPGVSWLHNISQADDCSLLRQTLGEFGVRSEINGEALLIHGIAELAPSQIALHMANAGTTLRFMLPLIAFTEGSDVSIDGNRRMRERPLAEFLMILRDAGATIDGNRLPLRVRGILPPKRISLSLPELKSSQFLSSLMLASTLISGEVDLKFTKTQSSVPYIHMTSAVMRHFGLEHELTDISFYKPEDAEYLPTRLTIEPDASSAAYFFALGALRREPVTVRFPAEESLQGDLAMLDVLGRAGATVVKAGDSISVCGPLQAQHVSTSIRSCPDLAPALAVVAATLAGESTFSEAKSLQEKESNRGVALTSELTKLGVHAHYDGKSLRVRGPIKNGATLNTYEDHRLVMAWSILERIANGIALDTTECVTKSCPEFFPELRKC